MEHFDVVIIGGGSAGLAALKQLSNLKKQAVLIEAGKTVGSKNMYPEEFFIQRSQRTARSTTLKMSMGNNF
jgi:cation diffusion facilitator CzcD-associated flavoprotein CzcO